MEYLPLICMFVAIICAFIAYIAYDCARSETEALSIRMRDLLQRQLDMVEFKNATSSRLLKLNLGIKDLVDKSVDDEKQQDFVVQEIIRLDRELSKLRPVLRLVKPAKVKK